MQSSMLIGLMFLASQLNSGGQDSTEVKISAEATHSISPYIYGFGTFLREDRTAEGLWDLKPSFYRWGGNTSTRYNYKTNAWNSAQDWYFHNYSGGQSNIIDRFMAENVKQGVASAITLPMQGWVAKDGTSYSFPRSAHPQQDAFDGNAGNGLLRGEKLLADPTRANVAIDPKFVASWVSKLKNQFGKHPHFYIMDNEPMLWHSTHRDVQPVPMGYDAYLSKYIAYAAAVRAADPEAIIIGPAEWGWMGMMNSGFDIEGPWNNWKKGTDRKKHGDKPFLEWFLEQIAAEEKKRQVSLLDIIDVHFYPEKDSWPRGSDASPAVRKALFQSTRSLWDRSYIDKSWIDDRIYFIPRLQEMAKKFKPGAKVSIGEYNFRSEMDLSGALAQADILGIFAKHQLYAAQYWDFPKKEGSHRYAFRLFRDFDGKGAGFASQWVDNSVGIQDEVSVFTARDANRLTVVIVNKSLERAQNFDLDLSQWPLAKSARLVKFVEARQNRQGFLMNPVESTLRVGKTLSVSTGALSMQIVEVLF